MTEVEAGLHHPEGPRREHGALVVEARHQHVDAVADDTEHVIDRHFAVGEHELAGIGAAHAELVELLPGGKAGKTVFDDERGDAARAGGAVGLGVDDERIGERTVGDPHFRAVEDIAVALALGAGAHRHHVGAGIRLRHRQRPDMLAGNELRQIALLLLGAGVAPDLVDAEIGMRAVGKADRRRAAGNLLHRHAMGEIAHAGAAPFLLDRDAEQAERAELRPQLARKFVGAVDLSGAWRDFFAGEGADRLAQHIDVVAEAEIEAGEAVRDHRALLPAPKTGGIPVDR